MDNQQQHTGGVPGPAGRRLHIAHRRSPSEMTPMIMEQLALQHQIEQLQQQQQQIAGMHQQYVNMGMIPSQQQLPTVNYPQQQLQSQVPVGGLQPHPNAFQFPQQMQPQQQQQLGMAMNVPTQPGAHRRHQSALPNTSMGPPPAPSSGSAFGDLSQQGLQGGGRDSGSSRGGNRSGPPAGAGHQRRHSLALPEAKKAAELAQQKRTTSGFQFPIPGAAGASPTTAPKASSPLANEDKPADQLSVPGSLSPVSRAGNRGSTTHMRSQSMATGSGRGMPPGRGANAFQFPANDSSAGQQQSDLQRRGSNGHARTSSRNFDGNWRQPGNGQQNLQEQQSPSTMGNFGQSQSQNPTAPSFQPGHRARGSMNQSIGSMGQFQFPNQPQLVQMPQNQILLQQPQMFAGQQLNPVQLSQLQALQTAQMGGQQFVVPGMQPGQGSMANAQQQRKTLFTPYLPQSNLPTLLANDQLVAGILRVNKKNRSDAYVTASDLDADIFICGSKDRNRALEGDYVAIELLDVDEVWGQKREKEEKKKRKDISDARTGTNGGNTDGRARSDSATNADAQSAVPEGGLRRRGSLRQRPTQKKNDDVEVEGQSLLLMEEEEISDEQKPLYAGHVVAVIERVPGQMFSGTLGLLRPSSQATKEKQEAERHHRDGGGRHQQDRQQEKPKIVWFKPTDKRVPLIAIPTEQAPRDFVERHQDYANRIFVACIKRWPITSLHPFGTLVEQLGEMGDLGVETDALLRDNNFGPDDFSDAVLKNTGFDNWSVATEAEATVAARRDFRSETTFTIDPNGSQDLDDAIHVKEISATVVELGIHVADVAHFVKVNSLVDREAKKRGTAVYLVNRTVNMLPPKLASEVCSLSPGEERFTVSVVFKVNLENGSVVDDDFWVGKSIIKSNGKLSYDVVDAVIGGQKNVALEGAKVKDIEILKDIAQKFRIARYGSRSKDVPPLRLIQQLDDENVPVEHNLFASTPAHEIIEELSHKANTVVARKLAAALPEKAFLRTQAPPNARRLQTFAERMTAAGHKIDTTSSGTLQGSMFNVKEADLRKGMETLLVKAMQRAKYAVAEKVKPEQYQHFALNLPLYTHFTNPFRRYGDIVVHRQLEVALSDGALEFTEDVESLAKIAEACNTKKDSAQSAQEQSVHIEQCRVLDKKRVELGGDLISEGVVLCVYESAFDILIPEYGFEKRVHCDQLPLKKAEFRKEQRVLELYWEKGVPSSAYVPEDERSNARSQQRTRGNAADAAKQRAKEVAEMERKQTDTGTMSTDDVDALFDDDDNVSDLADATAGVSLDAERRTQNLPSAPNGADATSARPGAPESKLTNKEKYLKFFKLREEGGEYIQDVTEMTRVPVILKTDLTKSPPCLTIRSMNPYAL